MEAQQAEGTSGASPLLDGWLTRAQLAAELGVSPDTLERWDRRRIGPPCARIGRATLYGAAAGGSEGAARAIEILKTEIDTAMAMVGVTSLEQLDRGYLRAETLPSL